MSGMQLLHTIFVPTLVTGHYALLSQCLFITVRVSGFVVYERVCIFRPVYERVYSGPCGGFGAFCAAVASACAAQAAVRTRWRDLWSLQCRLVARLQPAFFAFKVSAATWPQIARWFCSQSAVVVFLQGAFSLCLQGMSLRPVSWFVAE